MSKIIKENYFLYLIILKFGTENDEQKEFLQKVVFIFEKLKFAIFRRITFYPLSDYTPIKFSGLNINHPCL
jgi:hypothetical protein